VNGRPVAVVTGAKGQLGQALAEQMASDYELTALSRSDLDVTSHLAVMERIGAIAPAVILNATAYNSVDAAEDDVMNAFSVNMMAVKSLARAAEATGAVLVHYSTDFVFDGTLNRPYTEDDYPSPRSVYGQSKLAGEWMAASVGRHYVVRVESLFGGRQRRSTIDSFVDMLSAGKNVRAFHDREVSPSFVDDVVMATRALLSRSAPFGTYHCVNSGHASWATVAQEIAKRLGVSEDNVVHVSVEDVVLRAARPQFAALDNSKLASVGIVLPHWRDALDRYIARR
jgi:dTDP-4-dehydrorhamnose reductase